MRARAELLAAAVLTIAAVPSCAPLPPPPPRVVPLPPLTIDRVVTASPDPAAGGDQPAPGSRITLTAANVPLRDVLPLIAEAAGVTLVLDPAVTGLVTFHFEDTPALEALTVLAREAGYELYSGPGGMALPFVPRTVFFLPPVNVNAAGVWEIRQRFGVSRQLAEWIVLSRSAW